jgi:predicted ABC-type transport system involved in lysophospholipase L1 biosynthesis ATPase subunit
MISALKQLFTRKTQSDLPPSLLIALEGVARAFDDGAIVALKSIDLAIHAGECVAILGPSGSGKSSIVNLLSGIDRPTAGQILWNGKPVKSRRAWARLRRDGIGIVFQEFNLLPTLTASENVEMALMARGVPAEERRVRAHAALERVGLAHRVKHLPHALSGGERQRVAIARSIVNAPRLLLADEPTGNLDSANAEIVADLLFNLQRDTGTTLVLVTHDEKLAARCRRCVRVRDGEVAADRIQAPVLALPIAKDAAPIAEPAEPVAKPDAPVAVAEARIAEAARTLVEAEPPIAEATAAIARAGTPVTEAAE